MEDNDQIPFDVFNLQKKNKFSESNPYKMKRSFSDQPTQMFKFNIAEQQQKEEPLKSPFKNDSLNLIPMQKSFSYNPRSKIQKQVQKLNP